MISCLIFHAADVLGVIGLSFLGELGGKHFLMVSWMGEEG